jgi:hypothetical protein
LRGRIKIHEGFDELPPDIAVVFGMEDQNDRVWQPG